MPLDPQAQKIIDALAALNLPPVEDSTPEEARESMRSRTAALGPFEDVAAVTDHRVPVKNGEITVRVYSPGGKGPQPALVFFHGGGWVIGDLYTHDGICRSITNAAACVVASVDYRLAPELKYPVAAEDSYAGYAWVLANAGKLGIDARRVAVGGDSAGGNLAAAVSLMARDRGTPVPIQQTLIYPVTNHSLDTPSYRENATGFLLTRDAMRWFWNHYLASEGQGKEPYASPLLAKSPKGRDLIVLPQKSGMAYALDPDKDGALVWQYRIGQGSGLGGQWGAATDGQNAYFGVADFLTQNPGGMHAVNLDTGQRAWYTPPQPKLCDAAGRACSAAQGAAVTVIPGAVLATSHDGGLRAYATKDGSIIWQFDTNRDFDTVNGVTAKGGSMDGPGPVVVGGMVYVNSGYGGLVGRPGNVLLAFGIE